jgi:hypothetical protein
MVHPQALYRRGKLLDMAQSVGYNVSVDQSERTGEHSAFLNLGSYQSGQMGLTVNQLRELRRFESSTAHQYRSSCMVWLARVAQR